MRGVREGVVEGVAVVADEHAVFGCGARHAGGCDVVIPGPGGPGPLIGVHVAPSHWSTGEFGRLMAPTAMQSFASPHETLLSEPGTAPDAVVQLEPSHCSTRVFPPLVPTAVQVRASAHATLASEPATARARPSSSSRSIARSASVGCRRLRLRPRRRTSCSRRRDRRARCGRTRRDRGGRRVHAVPFHCSRKARWSAGRAARTSRRRSRAWSSRTPRRAAGSPKHRPGSLACSTRAVPPLDEDPVGVVRRIRAVADRAARGRGRAAHGVQLTDEEALRGGTRDDCPRLAVPAFGERRRALGADGHARRHRRTRHRSKRRPAAGFGLAAIDHEAPFHRSTSCAAEARGPSCTSRPRSRSTGSARDAVEAARRRVNEVGAGDDRPRGPVPPFGERLGCARGGVAPDRDAVRRRGALHTRQVSRVAPGGFLIFTAIHAAPFTASR